jgi:hypothetical protein
VWNSEVSQESCHVISYHIMATHIMLYHMMSCHVIPYHIISCHIISYHAVPVFLGRHRVSFLGTVGTTAWAQSQCLSQFLDLHR